jgi:hypothetical protein
MAKTAPDRSELLYVGLKSVLLRQPDASAHPPPCYRQMINH